VFSHNQDPTRTSTAVVQSLRYPLTIRRQFDILPWLALEELLNKLFDCVLLGHHIFAYPSSRLPIKPPAGLRLCVAARDQAALG
jgi:hypothetical protein